MLDLVLVRGLVGHQAARFARTGTGTGFGVGAIVGVVSSTIALMKIIGNQNNIGMTRTPLRMSAAGARHTLQSQPSNQTSPLHLDNVELLVPVPAAVPTPTDSQKVMSSREPERTRPLSAS
jgi:hypothetical protein